MSNFVQMLILIVVVAMSIYIILGRVLKHRYNVQVMREVIAKYSTAELQQAMNDFAKKTGF